MRCRTWQCVQPAVCALCGRARRRRTSAPRVAGRRFFVVARLQQQDFDRLAVCDIEQQVEPILPPPRLNADPYFCISAIIQTDQQTRRQQQQQHSSQQQPCYSSSRTRDRALWPPPPFYSLSNALPAHLSLSLKLSIRWPLPLLPASRRAPLLFPNVAPPKRAAAPRLFACAPAPCFSSGACAPTCSWKKRTWPVVPFSSHLQNAKQRCSSFRDPPGVCCCKRPSLSFCAIELTARRPVWSRSSCTKRLGRRTTVRVGRLYDNCSDAASLAQHCPVPPLPRRPPRRQPRRRRVSGLWLRWSGRVAAASTACSNLEIASSRPVPRTYYKPSVCLSRDLQTVGSLLYH